MLINFSLGPPWRPLFIVIYKGGNPFWQGLKIDIFEHIFFWLAPRFRSKLKQDVNISPFVDHFTLKNPRALATFLHANQINMYTWDKIVNSRNFCWPLSFFQIMSLGRCWVRTLDGSYRLHSFTFYSQLKSRLTISGSQKQASCGWRLIYANYYPRYSLRKHPFLLAFRRWGRFARRNVCDSAIEILYWWRKSMFT